MNQRSNHAENSTMIQMRLTCFKCALRTRKASINRVSMNVRPELPFDRVLTSGIGRRGLTRISPNTRVIQVEFETLAKPSELGLKFGRGEEI
jgi:hypothetical protein